MSFIPVLHLVIVKVTWLVFRSPLVASDLRILMWCPVEHTDQSWCYTYPWPPWKIALNLPFPIHLKSHEAFVMWQAVSQAMGTQKWTQKSNAPVPKELIFSGLHYGPAPNQDSRTVWRSLLNTSSTLAQTQEEKNCLTCLPFRASVPGGLRLSELSWTHTGKDSEKHITFPQSHVAVSRSLKADKLQKEFISTDPII